MSSVRRRRESGMFSTWMQIVSSLVLLLGLLYSGFRGSGPAETRLSSSLGREDLVFMWQPAFRRYYTDAEFLEALERLGPERVSLDTRLACYEARAPGKAWTQTHVDKCVETFGLYVASFLHVIFDELIARGREVPKPREALGYVVSVMWELWEPLKEAPMGEDLVVYSEYNHHLSDSSKEHLATLQSASAADRADWLRVTNKFIATTTLAGRFLASREQLYTAVALASLGLTRPAIFSWQALPFFLQGGLRVRKQLVALCGLEILTLVLDDIITERCWAGEDTSYIGEELYETPVSDIELIIHLVTGLPFDLMRIYIKQLSLLHGGQIARITYPIAQRVHDLHFLLNVPLQKLPPVCLYPFDEDRCELALQEILRRPDIPWTVDDLLRGTYDTFRWVVYKLADLLLKEEDIRAPAFPGFPAPQPPIEAPRDQSKLPFSVKARREAFRTISLAEFKGWWTGNTANLMDTIETAFFMQPVTVTQFYSLAYLKQTVEIALRFINKYPIHFLYEHKHWFLLGVLVRFAVLLDVAPALLNLADLLSPPPSAEEAAPWWRAAFVEGLGDAMFQKISANIPCAVQGRVRMQSECGFAGLHEELPLVRVHKEPLPKLFIRADQFLIDSDAILQLLGERLSRRTLRDAQVHLTRDGQVVERLFYRDWMQRLVQCTPQACKAFPRLQAAALIFFVARQKSVEHDLSEAAIAAIRDGTGDYKDLPVPKQMKLQTVERILRSLKP